MQAVNVLVNLSSDILWYYSAPPLKPKDTIDEQSVPFEGSIFCMGLRLGVLGPLNGARLFDGNRRYCTVTFRSVHYKWDVTRNILWLRRGCYVSAG